MDTWDIQKLRLETPSVSSSLSLLCICFPGTSCFLLSCFREPHFFILVALPQPKPLHVFLCILETRHVVPSPTDFNPQP